MRIADDQALIQAFASELKAGRARLLISQEELAGLADVNRTFVGKIETGLNQPSLCTFVKIARGLGMDPAELLANTMKRAVKERRQIALTEKRNSLKID
jgi:transcriptional regulator with XRE-family HTH domain